MGRERCRNGKKQQQKDDALGKTRWRGVREVYGRKEKVTQTHALAHTRKHTHTQSTLAALNVACRRKFWNLSLGTRQAGSSQAARERVREREKVGSGGREGGRSGRTRGVLLELPWLLSAYRQHEATATLSHMQPLVHTAWFCRDDQNKSTTLLGQSLCVRIYWGMYQVCASIKNKTLFFTVILKSESNVGGISFLICIQKEVKWPVSSAPKICSI